MFWFVFVSWCSVLVVLVGVCVCVTVGDCSVFVYVF